MKKKILSCMLSALFFFIFSTTIYANSGVEIWSGVNTMGAAVQSDNCPLVVESELLTFDIHELPKNYYETQEEFNEYKCNVTAEYKIKNPTSETINATLLFPFGQQPAYSATGDDITVQTDYNNYKITVEGKEIAKNIRHSYKDDFEFNYDKDAKYLHDDYISDDFYSPNMPVKLYSFEFYGGKDDEQIYFLLSDLKIDSSKTKLLLEYGYYNTAEGDTIHLETSAENNKCFILYVIGEDIDAPPQWNVYEDYEHTIKTAGTVDLIYTDTYKFSDLCKYFYDSEYGVSEIDWYNAVVPHLYSFEDNGYLGSENSLDVTYNLMRWYQYDISVASHQTITNTVSAPIYPLINEEYEPSLYEYTYLLSPAKKWRDFKKLDIVINTPYFISDCSIGEVETTENGYALSLKSLPNKELSFFLCESENPKDVSNPYAWLSILPFIVAYAVYFGVPIIILLVIIAVIIIAISLTVRKIKKKK